jgi:hypothetical protein
MPSVKEEHHDECNQDIEQFKIHRKSISFIANLLLVRSGTARMSSDFCIALQQSLKS